MAHLADKDENFSAPLVDWLTLTSGLLGLGLAVILSIIAATSAPDAPAAPAPQIEAMPL